MMLWRHPIILASLAAVAVFSLLAAGCGSGSPRVANIAAPATTTTTTTTTTTMRTAQVAFARCMRSDGVPRYPDFGKPTPQQVGVSASQFDTAVSACRHLLPRAFLERQQTKLEQRIRDRLAFAHCMRDHGIGYFPDPDSQGDYNFTGTGINPHALSPTVLAAGRTCLPTAHGAVHPPSQTGP